ncbi:putative chromatin regulator PHD family [Medicago truncatula]|uniref:Putative chromatin regulator PHD family n=1 Tax=Medicago truncatula TaxID=3880 RepID=G7JND0_MEDTR|nr:E3 ubiquitin-protein ligase WAV3 [Medicago truncatula]AES88560.1 zinc finger, C3HC4 type (RING finger) protein [Medicago truncatula]RHN60714.1 putative chromatin regulator PHD family [Medicago truncatula]
MGSKWRKVKLALGLNSCVHIPQPLDDSSAARFSGATSSAASSLAGDTSGYSPSIQSPSSSGFRLLKSPKGTCAICLNTMKPGNGHAIFTAECSHSFHFHCITSNVKHGNQICPVCRSKWKEVPFQSPTLNPRSSQLTREDGWPPAVRRLPSPQANAGGQISSLYHVSEPAIFDDDESIDQHASIPRNSNNNEANHNVIDKVEIRTCPEVSSVPKSASCDAFAVLIHLKAPQSESKQNIPGNNTDSSPPPVEKSRASVDLVTVLDVSGSMLGTKLALLKRAMGFVIQNMGPSDRLSVIAFSSTARRIFPLRKMTEIGRQEALQAVNSLVSNGGTNIAEGLRKGAKVFSDRRWKNPVSSIILLSDGQDTYTVNSRPNVGTNYQSLVPNTIHRNNSSVGLQIPVHAFGFGADHDATSMHSISEISGGTFSFIEAEDVIQDAFAQCIGGLLSVVVQELQLEIRCVHPQLQLGSVKAGSYRTSLTTDGRMASITVGDLYAEEERDFLVTVNVPIDSSNDEMSLLNVKGFYRDPITKEMIALEETSEVKIERPNIGRELVVSIEVDRQLNRLRAAEAMAEARVAAERGELSAAVSVLDSCHKTLSESVSAKAGDRLCIALAAELQQMQERMANQHVYEQSGRAYVLSGLSSHSAQRATTRGDSTDSSSLLQSYQTPSMVDMVTRSQTIVLGAPLRRSLQPAKSFPERHRR